MPLAISITKKSLAVISSCCLKSSPCMSIMDVLLLARIWWVLEILGQSELCGLEEYAISQNFEMCTCQIVTIGCWLVIYQTSFIFRRLTIIFNIGQENKNRLNLVLNSNSQIRAKSRDTQV